MKHPLVAVYGSRQVAAAKGLMLVGAVSDSGMVRRVRLRRADDGLMVLRCRIHWAWWLVLGLMHLWTWLKLRRFVRGRFPRWRVKLWVL